MHYVSYSIPIYAKNSDKQAWANIVDPDQIMQNAASDQVQHCLLLNQQVLDTITWIHSNLQ